MDRIHRISLNKQKASDKWEADINDTKLQEIATALKCSLNIVAPGSAWYLYRGEADTTGVYITFASNYFRVKIRCNGIDATDYQKSVYMSESYPICMTYVHGLGDNVAWGVAEGGQDAGNYINMLIVSAKNINTEENATIYTLSYYNSNSKIAVVTSTGIAIGDFDGYVYSAGTELVTVLVPLVIVGTDHALVCDNVYMPYAIKNSGGNHYYFTLNNKEYILLDGQSKSSDSYNVRGQWAMELPSEE
nr:MAG TPA: hypothetical protein [Caudoviricetes sp.]